MKPSLHRLLRVVALGMGISLMTATTASANIGRDDSFHRPLTFATYNIDLGADLSPVFGATGLSLIQKAATAWAEVQASNFPERAQSLARLLAKRSPDVIGLQEVALWQTGSFNPANPLDPNVVFTTNYDFLVLLRDALAARGFKYAIADDNITFVGQAPVSLSQQVRYTDRNVILVRAGHHGVDYTTPAPGGHVYAARIPTSVGGVSIAITRGWASTDLRLEGRSVRVFDTHLEAYSEVVRNLQATELAATTGAAQMPVVLLGDMNSRPTGCGNVNTVAYSILAGAGLTEVWPAVHKHDPCGGYTSDLANWPTSLDHRIDDIFFTTSALRAVSARVIGNRPWAKTPSGLWPSDHAGSIGALRLHHAAGHEDE